MIKLRDFTPEVYYKESRDFQLLGRLFDLVLNSVKTEADLLYDLPVNDNSNEQLLDLLSLSVGFKTNNNRYNAKQLKAICRVFPLILHNKGSIKALIIACNALFSAEGCEQPVDYEFVDDTNNNEINLYIPQDFEDLTLLNDLLQYVLPAGMSCNIIREYRLKVAALTELTFTDTVYFYRQGDRSISLEGDSNVALLYDSNTLAVIPTLVNVATTDTNQSNRTDRLNFILDTRDLVNPSPKDNAGFIGGGQEIYIVPNATPATITETNIKDRGEELVSFISVIKNDTTYNQHSSLTKLEDLQEDLQELIEADSFETSVALQLISQIDILITKIITEADTLESAIIEDSQEDLENIEEENNNDNQTT
jgi:hypothetical protein